MIEPATPANETERLAALRALGVLDTVPEERFDRVTRMAKRLFGVPIATVSLVDENRQWFKSCDGLDASETDRSLSFCGHAILGTGPLVVNDALADERFADNPLVVGAPHIRFYAGYPLSTPSGLNMGTLCIFGTEPRQFDQQDEEGLKDLAGIVEGELLAIQLTLTDDLTRISNRRGFELLAQYSIELCRRQGIPAHMVFFDLDKFKSINDEFGHEEGDRALRLCAEEMRKWFRSSDVFGRLGGDEFAVLMTSTQDESVCEKMDRFAYELAESCRKLDLPYVVELSAGVVAFEPLRHSGVADLLREADVQMYVKKRRKQAAEKASERSES